MTDTFFSQASETPAAPAPAPEAPASAAPAAPARTAFDDNLDDFLSRDLFSEMTPQVQEPAPAASPAVSAPAAQPAVSGSAPVAPAGAPQTPQPAPANGGTPPATTVLQPADGAASPQVDPNLLMEMFQGAQPVPTVPAPAAAPAPQAPPAASAAEEPYAPFTSAMQLPQQLVQTLFESEDPVQRTQALTGLMAALGNAAVGLMEQRIAQHHTPRMVEQFQNEQSVRAQAAQVNQDFYGKYPELRPYQTLVAKAGQVYAAKNPGVQYSEATRDAIAALARQAAVHMGATLTPAAQAAPAPIPAPQAVAPRATPYVAGGSTPGGPLDQPVSDNSPGGVFEQMMNGF